MQNAHPLKSTDVFVDRHIGPRSEEVERMLAAIGCSSLADLIEKTVPRSIQMSKPLELPPARTEREILSDLADLSAENKPFRSFLGLGYSDCVTPPVILRNILEDPGWYTQYTAYQSEISQGRLEALLNFQTMVADLTGLPVANSSLLDEATAAAEAMTLCHRMRDRSQKSERFLVASDCHPQTIAVVQTRAQPLNIEVAVIDPQSLDQETDFFAVLLQYPATDGEIRDYAEFAEKVHQAKAFVVVACDLLALTLLRAPGEFGADVAVGNSQRFGVPLGYGGPHAAFMSSKSEFQRKLPGRVVGMSRDRAGKPALRLALQTREQHIRRDRATSNICTAQVLLAVTASMYGVYHGPHGLRRIARRVHVMTQTLAALLERSATKLCHKVYFDSLRLTTADPDARIRDAEQRLMNLRKFDNGDLGIALDEATNIEDLQALLAVFGVEVSLESIARTAEGLDPQYAAPLQRRTEFMTSPVFSRYHTETELLRYMRRLQGRDLSLTSSMIPLGSCTMKLNATAEMIPVTWPGFAAIHPFAPTEQTQGYQKLFVQLERWLAEITGFAAVSLQPNAGSQGEYAGLLVIRAYHASRGDDQRRVCLIPVSAHGTNPASAVLAGMNVVPVRCDGDGNIDVEDLLKQANKHRDQLAALMVTYPSTHGVFEEAISEICSIVHEAGGQVYLDGANMNAMVGICQPGALGADVCHLNLHKTFCIPHGGGGPGMGPIGVASHLVQFLPKHPLVEVGGEAGIGAVSAAPWGSPMVLPISYAYIAMMGAEGLHRATQIAILNANYIAKRLESHYPVLYRGKQGFVAHECIVDLRPLSKATGVDVEDVAKRLMDYGFHAPTMSFPVPGTLMIEPTESESLQELDRFCEAMLAIRQEIQEVADGKADAKNNVLKYAPHTLDVLLQESWDRPYSREKAAFPTEYTREYKCWPSVERIDNVYGDRNLVCCWIPEFNDVAEAGS